MKKLILIAFLLLPSSVLLSQNNQSARYWNQNTQLIPWRLPLPVTSKIEYLDLDQDGDPDVLKAVINDSIPIMWIDDGDNMKYGDIEGSIINGCLLIDRNRDGIFAGPEDISIKWGDEDGDGIADIQLIVNNSKIRNRYGFDFDADFMFFIDTDRDKIMHYVDWNILNIQAWEHNGHSNFYSDYSGNSIFLKMHASSFRIGDMRYSWENPFIFYDTDNDNLTEWAIRLVDNPKFRTPNRKDPDFDNVDKEVDVLFSHKISDVRISWDLDNDNGQGNEFDFDMSLGFNGDGFDYSDQVHKFKSLRGITEADKFFYDAQWRHIEELIYADEKTSWNHIFSKGEWTESRFVFDEDDDCNRWERVEFYDPGDPFTIGLNKGGLDNNQQADAEGDRGEWDKDNSGKGQLYIGAFDGRIHLYGAEWGAWRIDQTAYSFQGYGGLYGRWGWGRIQGEPQKFGTVKYTDTDNNGFIDLIEYDLDGDKIFEDKASLKKLGIDDICSVMQTANMKYSDFQKMFSELAENMWNRAQDAIQIAKESGTNTNWYSFWMQPHSMREKYDFGYWLSFYLYHDLRDIAKALNDTTRINLLDKAYYSGNWKLAM